MELLPCRRRSQWKTEGQGTCRGSVEAHPEGSYYLQWREGKSRIRQPVPEKADVLDLARRKRLELEAQKAGVPLAEAGEEAPAGPTVHEAVAAYHAGYRR